MFAAGKKYVVRGVHHPSPGHDLSVHQVQRLSLSDSESCDPETLSESVWHIVRMHALDFREFRYMIRFIRPLVHAADSSNHHHFTESVALSESGRKKSRDIGVTLVHR